MIGAPNVEYPYWCGGLRIPAITLSSIHSSE